MNFKDLLITETKKSIEQERADREVKKTISGLMKKQKTKSQPAFIADIYTIHGGASMTVYSFAKNASEAIKDIKSRPDFKSFSKRPVKIKLSL